jgi:hypothetical protein
MYYELAAVKTKMLYGTPDRRFQVKILRDYLAAKCLDPT